MRRAGETTAPKRYRRHSEISPIFLNQNICGDFGCAKERMFRVIDAHCLGNTSPVLVTGLDFPAFLQFAQRQVVRCVAIDLVRGSKNERSLWRKLSRCLEQIQGAIGVHGEISLRIAHSPVV